MVSLLGYLEYLKLDYGDALGDACDLIERIIQLNIDLDELIDQQNGQKSYDRYPVFFKHEK